MNANSPCRVTRRTPIAALVALLAACGGGGGDAGSDTNTNGTPTENLTAIADVSSNVDPSICPYGGTRIQTGIDKNANGVLDPTEVSDTSYVCNGAPGATGSPGATGAPGANGLNSLAKVTVEPPGTHCPSGGSQIQVGMDANANGILDATEVTSTTFICNGAMPAGGDFTPPQISTAAPQIASSSKVEFTTTMSDDVELAYIRPFSIISQGIDGFEFLPEGVKNYQVNEVADILLGETISRMMVAVDISGNVTKKTVSIASPEPAIKLGRYTTVGTYNLPAGFNCMAGTAVASEGVQDGTAVTHVHINSEPEWSVTNGYRPWLGFGSDNVWWASGTALANIPLDGTSTVFDFISGSQSFYPFDTYEYGYTGTAVLLQSDPKTLRITVNMKCNINNAGFINGSTATFDVQMLP